MEDIQSKRIKMAHEKYCSECGEIILLKAEICPKCGVRQLPVFGTIESATPKNKKLGEKFLYSTGTSFLGFIILILATTPQHTWMNGFIGSCMFALFSGAIAMVIPTTRKTIYLPVSFSIMFFIAMVIGLSIKK
jgi:ribosomal protein L32